MDVPVWRGRLMDLAHEEAEAEDTVRSSNKNETAASNTEKEKTPLRVGDFQRLILETESGNTYIVQKSPTNEGYLIANFREGTIVAVPSTEIENSTIIEGEQFFFERRQTSTIKSAKTYK